LFHLLDVSREENTSRTSCDVAPAPCDVAPDQPTDALLARLPAAECETPAPAFELPASPDSLPAPSLSITLSAPPSRFDPTPTLGGSEIFDEPVPADIETDPAAGVTEAEQVPHDGVQATVDRLHSDPPTAADESTADESTAHAATPRSTQAARRQPKTVRREDWFAQHGKYIAIGFVLALVGTIYLARSNRGTGEHADRVPTHDHPGAAGDLASSVPKPAPATVLGEAKPLPGSPASGTSEVSPAQLVETASGSSKADLHPPAAPEVASGEAVAKQDLFSFAKKSEERVAARPAGPTPIENHTLDAATEPAKPAYPQTPYPAEIPVPEKPPMPQPVYPTTTGPETAPEPAERQHQQPQPQYQPSQPPPAVYGPPAPQYGPLPSRYGSPPPPYQSPPPQYPQYQPTNAGPPTAQPPTAPAEGAPPPSIYGHAPPATPVGVVPPQYQSQTDYTQNNSARGIRYERTGSGLY
jgi:hypothetical protein